MSEKKDFIVYNGSMSPLTMSAFVYPVNVSVLVEVREFLEVTAKQVNNFLHFPACEVKVN